tara:strand:- start:679 stop:891 length:213 start_codon:yes stop_codon:yes gene_type:complete
MAADGNGKTVFKLPDGSKLDLKNLPSKDEDVTVAHLEVCRDAIFKLQKKLAVAGNFIYKSRNLESFLTFS